MGIEFWKKTRRSSWFELYKKNKKRVWLFASPFLLLMVVVILFSFKQGVEKKEEARKQVVEEARQTRMSSASWSRVSFFEGLPINVSFAMPDYLEGNYRMIKGQEKVDFLYIKDPSNPTPLFYIRIDKGEGLSVSENEKELKSSCSSFKFIYRLYESESYQGENKKEFEQALYDIAYFLSQESYFQCRERN